MQGNYFKKSLLFPGWKILSIQHYRLIHATYNKTVTKTHSYLLCHLNNRKKHFNIHYLSIYKLVECHFQWRACSLPLVFIWKNAVIGEYSSWFSSGKMFVIFPRRNFNWKSICVTMAYVKNTLNVLRKDIVSFFVEKKIVRMTGGII